MFRCLVALSLVLLASAEHSSPHRYLPTPRKAVVSIEDHGSNSSVKGVVHFTETSQGIHITGTITGLTEGLHGFHVHAVGDISGGCASTLGHFNPHNVSHGAPDASERHVGDLGNIEANASGVAVLDFYDKIIALDGEHNIIGRGIVVHEKADDLGLGGAEDSKTTGHAGGRVGCGVIGTLNPENTSGTSSLVFTGLSMIFAISAAALHRLV